VSVLGREAEEYLEYCRQKDAHDAAVEARDAAEARSGCTLAALEHLMRGAGVIDSPAVLRALEVAWDAGRRFATGAAE
jgi:uncharacterized protein YecE (DUF72 family)